MSEPSSQSTTARKVRGQSHFHGGLERTLDTTGFVIMNLGTLLSMVALILTRATAFAAVLQLLVAAWVCRVILRALAEHLRLQKRAQGLPYDGQISAAREEVTYACSECGAMLHSATRCESCGRALAGEGTSA